MKARSQEGDGVGHSGELERDGHERYALYSVQNFQIIKM